MKSAKVIRRKVAIRKGMEIVKEVEAARDRYQSSKTKTSPTEKDKKVKSNYSETDEIIDRLKKANKVLQTI